VPRLSIDYARHRHQFGRPIGKFDAIQHKLADGLIDLRLALDHKAKPHDPKMREILGYADARWPALPSWYVRRSALKPSSEVSKLDAVGRDPSARLGAVSLSLSIGETEYYCHGAS